ncbi:hypothetical protein EDD11_008344 [Mortierella claussenii]|nr:hypothetical protein EDD11_008344 [Mortierella claussenii]
MSNQDRGLLSGHLLKTLQTMARVHTDLLREGLLVTNLYIARTFGSFPAIDGDQAQEHNDKRMEHFNNILLKGQRESFFSRLLNRLIRWGSDDSDLRKTKSPASVASDKIFWEYLQITSRRQAPPFRPEDRDICESSFMSQCARTLSDMVGGHVYKFSLELKKRVLLHNPPWASSESGKALLDSIDDTTGRSQKHDCLSIHLILNLILPAKAQIQILPQIGYKDGFFSFTERHLVRCLMKDFRMTRNNRLIPTVKKARRLSSAEQEKQTSLAKLIADVFGSKKFVDENTQDEVGRLSLCLFLNGKNTSYRRGSNMLWVKDSWDPASSSSSSNPPPTLQQKHLQTKVVFQADDMSAIKEARTALEKMEPKDPQYTSIKRELKDLVRRSLQCSEQYQEQIDKSRPGQPRRKYVLTGNLSTNGHDLRVMAYKLTESKRSRLPATMTDADIAEPSSASSEPAMLNPPVKTQSEPLLLNKDHDPAAWYPTSTKEQVPRKELLTAVSSTSPPVPTCNTVFPWSTAPRMQGWSYISRKFDSQDKIDSLLRNTNGDVGIRSLCIDPGVVSTATATLIHSSYEKDNINLSIPRGPRDNIDRRYRKQQSRLKVDAGITEIESRLQEQKPVEAKLGVGDSDVTMEGDSGITSNNQDTLEKAMKV